VSGTQLRASRWKLLVAIIQAQLSRPMSAVCLFPDPSELFLCAGVSLPNNVLDAGLGGACVKSDDCSTESFMYCANSCWEDFDCPDRGVLYPGVIGVCEPCQLCVFGTTDALSGSCNQCRPYYEAFGANIERLDNEGNHQDGTFWDTDNAPSGSAYIDCNVCAANVVTSATCDIFLLHNNEQLVGADPM
jgi:hypothetical protein